MLFRSDRDRKLTVFLAVTGLIAAIGCILGRTTIYYYPNIVLGHWDLLKILTLVSYMLLLSAPLVIDILGEKKWQAYKSEI